MSQPNAFPVSLLHSVLGDDPRIPEWTDWSNWSTAEHQHEVLKSILVNDNHDDWNIASNLVKLTWSFDRDFRDEACANFFHWFLSAWHEELERRIDGYVYILGSENFDAFKIGRAKNPLDRTKTLAIQLPYPVEVIHVIASENYVETESELHDAFKNRRLNGEWFRLTEGDIKYLKSKSVFRYPNYGGEASVDLYFFREYVLDMGHDGAMSESKRSL